MNLKIDLCMCFTRTKVINGELSTTAFCYGRGRLLSARHRDAVDGRAQPWSLGMAFTAFSQSLTYSTQSTTLTTGDAEFYVLTEAAHSK